MINIMKIYTTNYFHSYLLVPITKRTRSVIIGGFAFSFVIESFFSVVPHSLIKIYVMNFISDLIISIGCGFALVYECSY